MKERKFSPVWECTRFKVHLKEQLVTVKLIYGYAILKKIKGYWKLGTITYKNDKNSDPVQQVNLFTHTPRYEDGNFIINKKVISLKSFSFNEDVIYFSGILFGLIKKSYIKQMSA